MTHKSEVNTCRIAACIVAATSLGVLIPNDVSAQSRLQDQIRERSRIISAEKVKGEAEEEEERLRHYVYLETSGVYFNNADLRDYSPADPIPYVDVYDTDDKAVVGFTRLSGGLQYDIVKSLTFDVAASGVGLYGGNSSADSQISLDRMAFNWAPVANNNMYVALTAGRVPFSIGGAYQDFYFDDVVDGGMLDLFFGKAGGVRLLVDFYSTSFRPDDINLIGGTDSGTDTVRADGDNNVMRYGAVYENTSLLEGLELRAFGFYADIGATDGQGTGADRVFGVNSYGNQADGDYTWVAGARVGYNLSAGKFGLKTYGEFARSGGIDREAVQVGLFDIETAGNSFGLAALPDYKVSENLGLRSRFHFFYAEGAQHAGSNGARFSHGFTSMKARQVGGFATNQLAGWHPSSYVGPNGIEFQPHNIERISGTMSLQAGLGVDLFTQLELDLDFWYFMDTSSTNFNLKNAGTTPAELPYGYTEFDLLAQDRFGNALGMELDAELRWRPLTFLSFYLKGGVFLPGDFYKVEVDRSVGRGGADSRTNLGGDDTFLVTSLGSVVEF